METYCTTKELKEKDGQAGGLGFIINKGYREELHRIRLHITRFVQ